MALERTAINPWSWSVERGYDQGVLLSDPTRILYCSGQASMSEDGQPEHAHDMGKQLALSFANLVAVLDGAGMSIANLVRLTIYTTNVGRLNPHYRKLISRLGAAGVRPTTTILGVQELSTRYRLVELEGTAVA